MKIKNNSNKFGFTLVELMIVISIIGVLAVTLLPKLQGAQARSRDAGRIANINSVEAVLNTYFSDEGSFPTSPTGDANHNGCLSKGDGTVETSLELLFKGGKAPLDPQKNMKSAGCDTARSLSYYPLIKNGVDANSYLLITDVESFKKSNYVVNDPSAPDGPANSDGTTTFNDIKSGGKGTWGTPTAEDANAKKTVYAAIN